MEQFSCHVCGMISKDPDEVNIHMNQGHSIKLEVEMVNKKFCCSLCTFNTGNMNEFKTHQIAEHKKDLHNWMVDEVRVVYICEECLSEFQERSELENHIDKSHNGDKISSDIFPKKLENRKCLLAQVSKSSLWKRKSR